MNKSFIDEILTLSSQKNNDREHNIEEDEQ